MNAITLIWRQVLKELKLFQMKENKEDAVEKTDKEPQKTDHGDYWGEYGLIRKGAGLSESLARIPMVWAGYQIKNQPAPMDSHVSIADLFPTFCSAIGAEIPTPTKLRKASINIA